MKLEGVSPQRFVQIDEDGYFNMEGIRVADAVAGNEWLSSLTLDARGRAWITMNGEPIFVEAFDEPYVALDVSLENKVATFPYGHQEPIKLDSFTVDDWDRFHARTERGIPFVLSRAAQARLFDSVDDFDDDSFTIGDVTYATGPWLKENEDVNKSGWWSEIYRSEKPRWDLGGPTPALAMMVPQLKLQKSRVLVLGAGPGHDAAWFAQQGHIVTAIDFSEDAIAKAREKYAHLSNLNFKQADVFSLPPEMNGQFDIVFEHTLYCAITPSRRKDLVKVWRRVLAENGHLFGVFEARDKTFGPPFGGTEWEVRARLQKGFRPLYWMRLRISPPSREGEEFLVYAQRLATF